MPLADVGQHVAQRRPGLERLGQDELGPRQRRQVGRRVGVRADPGAEAVAAGEDGGPGGRAERVAPGVAEQDAGLRQAPQVGHGRRRRVGHAPDRGGVELGRVDPEVVADQEQDVRGAASRRRGGEQRRGEGRHPPGSWTR